VRTKKDGVHQKRILKSAEKKETEKKEPCLGSLNFKKRQTARTPWGAEEGMGKTELFLKTEGKSNCRNDK